MYNKKPLLKPIHLIIIAFVALVVVLTVITIQRFTNQNPFGPELKIDNFSTYFKGVPKDVQSSVFSNLYQTTSLNVPEGSEVPTSGAIIQKDSVTSEYSKTSDLTINNFIVDIEPIKQSFKVFFKWSKNTNNPNMGGDSVVITCITGSNSTYKSTYCQDNTGQGDPIGKLLNKNPIVTILPIEINEISDNATKYTHYKVSYRISDDNNSIILIITDYTGGNRSAALQQIRQSGYDPENYKIEYNNESAYQIPGRAPGAAQ